MKDFGTIYEALKVGRSIRRKTWDAGTQMFVSNGVLVQQTENGMPYAYDLSWYEMNAKDWGVIAA